MFFHLSCILPVVERLFHGLLTAEQTVDGHFPVIGIKEVFNLFRVHLFVRVLSQKLDVIGSEMMRIIVPGWSDIQTWSIAVYFILILNITILSRKKRFLLEYRVLAFALLIFSKHQTFS